MNENAQANAPMPSTTEAWRELEWSSFRFAVTGTLAMVLGCCVLVFAFTTFRLMVTPPDIAPGAPFAMHWVIAVFACLTLAAMFGLTVLVKPLFRLWDRSQAAGAGVRAAWVASAGVGHQE